MQMLPAKALKHGLTRLCEPMSAAITDEQAMRIQMPIGTQEYALALSQTGTSAACQHKLARRHASKTGSKQRMYHPWRSHKHQLDATES